MSYRGSCLKFRCHDNGVGRGRICLASFNSPPTNTPYEAQAASRYFLYERSYRPSLFCIKFRCHGNQGRTVKISWHHLIACPGEPSVRGKHLGDISYTRRVKGDFALNFVAMAMGLVVVEFVWCHSIAHPRIAPTRRKRHHDIFYTRGVIACFVSNFVAMASRVGRCKIWLTSFDSPTPKNPC